MIETLVTLLVFAIVVYAIVLVLGMIPLPAPIKTIVYLIVGIVMLMVLLNITGIYTTNIGGHGMLARNS